MQLRTSTAGRCINGKQLDEWDGQHATPDLVFVYGGGGGGNVFFFFLFRFFVLLVVIFYIVSGLLAMRYSGLVVDTGCRPGESCGLDVLVFCRDGPGDDVFGK